MKDSMTDLFPGNDVQTSGKSAGSVGIAAIAIIAVLAVVYVGYQAMNKPDSNSAMTALPITSDPATSPDTMASPATLKIRPSDAKYKDGVYDVVGEYVSPGGPESIRVKLTLKNNLITEVEVTPQAEIEKSVLMQGVFVANYKPLVVGKSITDLKLDKVAGSSLTPKGFNDALEKVRDSAQG